MFYSAVLLFMDWTMLLKFVENFLKCAWFLLIQGYCCGFFMLTGWLLCKQSL